MIDGLRRPVARAAVARGRDGGVHARAARLPDLRRHRASSPSGTCSRPRCRRRAPQIALAVILVLTTRDLRGLLSRTSCMVMFMKPRPADAPSPVRAGADAGRVSRHRDLDPACSASCLIVFVRSARTGSSCSARRPRTDQRWCGAPAATTGDGRGQSMITRGRPRGPVRIVSRNAMTLQPGIFRQYDIRGIVGQRPDRRRPRRASAAPTPRYLAEHGHRRRRRRRSRQSPERRRAPRCARARAHRERRGRRRHRRRADAAPVLGAAPPRRRRRHPDHRLAQSARVQRLQGLSLGTASLHGDEIQELYRAHATPRQVPAGTGTVRERAGRSIATSTTSSRASGRSSRRVKVGRTTAATASGALVAPQLFERLGRRRGRGLFCESDGTFPEPPSRSDGRREPRRTSSPRCARDGAELGIGFDGDADRIGVVDGEGNIIWGDTLLILYARDVLARTGPGQPIIFDVKCSQALPDAIEKARAASP